MKKLIITVMLVLGFASLSCAAPILNVAGDGFEDRASGAAYAHYENSGTLLFTQAGNVTTGGNGGASVYSVAELQDLLQSKASTLTGIGDFSDVTLSAADVTATSYGDGRSGTWATVPDTDVIEFYAVKAGSYFALYYVDPAAGTGSWSTFDIWSIGGPGTGGTNGPVISHFIGYNPSSVPVPEPGTLILLGVGIMGLGLCGKRIMMSKA